MESLKKDIAAADLKTAATISFNIASSIGIILVNKTVFDIIDFKFGTFCVCKCSVGGSSFHLFSTATTMTFFHFVVTFLGLSVCWQLKMFTPKLYGSSAKTSTGAERAELAPSVLCTVSLGSISCPCVYPFVASSFLPTYPFSITQLDSIRWSSFLFASSCCAVIKAKG